MNCCTLLKLSVVRKCNLGGIWLNFFFININSGTTKEKGEKERKKEKKKEKDTHTIINQTRTEQLDKECFPNLLHFFRVTIVYHCFIIDFK